MTTMPKEELELYSKLCKDFKIVFDVGCKDDIEYFNIKSDCEYHLFEPNVEFLNSLKSKLTKLNNPKNITVNEFGLSDISQNDCVYYRNTSSFIPHWCIRSVDNGDRYSLKKLDDYVSQNNIQHIDFLKIDVEGLDYNVVRGGGVQ